MKLKKIADIFSKYASFERIRVTSDPDISEVRFVNPGDICDDPRVLYFDVGQNAQRNVEGISIVSTDRKVLFTEADNVFFLGQYDANHAFSQVNSLIMKQQRYEIAFGHILYLLVNHGSITEAMNMSAKFLGRSLVLTDLSFKVLEYSTEVQVTDPIWKNNIERGYCSGDFISAINELIPSDRMPDDGTPFLVNCSASSESKLCAKLIYEKHHIGYIVLLDNNKGLLDYHFDYLPRIATIMVEFLRLSSSFDNYFADVASGILINVLEGENPEVSEGRLRASRITLPEGMRCVIFMPENSSKHTQAYLENRLKLLFPGDQAFAYGIFVVLVMRADELAILRELDDSNEIVLHSSEIGVSSEFTSLSEFPAKFRQAARACHFSHHTGIRKKLCMYEDYRFYDLLTSCSDEKLLEENIHESFSVLNSYDIKKGTLLLPTLKAYIANGMNSKDTAEKLFLHRNTLKYRLDKIQELTGLDFEDYDTGFKLQLSLRINELLNIY